MELELLEGELSIHRLDPDAEIPPPPRGEPLYCVSITTEEMTIICPSSVEVESQRTEHNWRAFRIVGPLDFSLTGILARLSRVLAEAEVSIFALSTFDTDIVMVRQDDLAAAKEALSEGGYRVVSESRIP